MIDLTTKGPPHPGPDRSNNFNFLRLLLASLVIVSHVPELADGDQHREPLVLAFGTMSFGELAVDGFFLLSGYLIAISWHREPDLGRFLRKRALRIVPGFYGVTAVLTLIVGPIANPGWWKEFRPGPFLLGLATLSTGGLPQGFKGLHYPELDRSLWTIRYEFLCYLGVAALGVLGLLRRRWVVLAIGLATMICYLGSFQIPTDAYLTEHHRWRFALTVTIPRLGTFFLTGLCYYLFRDWVRFTTQGICQAALFLFFGMFHIQWSRILLPVLGGYLLFAAAFAPSQRLRSFREWPDISYGVYLYAWPITNLLIWRWPDLNLWSLFAGTFTLAALAGLASWYGIEKPFLRLKRIGRDRPAVPVAELTRAV